jgi:hypothetical protein
MAHTMMFLIEPLGVKAIDVFHRQREVGGWGFQQKVVMVVHQYPGMANHRIFLDHLPQYLEEQTPIRVIRDDLSSFIPSGCDVIHSAFIMDSSGSGHANILIYKVTSRKV